jgi:hypothetical protein
MSIFDKLFGTRKDPAPAAKTSPAPKPERPALRTAPLMGNDLKLLPHWTQVAFAARCARRVQPAFNNPANFIGEEAMRGLDEAISAAERAAASAFCPEEDAALAAQQVKAAVESSGGNPDPMGGLVSPNDFARVAAQVAGIAVELIKAPNANFAAAAANLCLGACGFPMAGGTTTLAWSTLAAVRQDYEALKSLCEMQGCNDATAVPPEVFGPFWPEGAPEGWPAE